MQRDRKHIAGHMVEMLQSCNAIGSHKTVLVELGFARFSKPVWVTVWVCSAVYDSLAFMTILTYAQSCLLAGGTPLQCTTYAHTHMHTHINTRTHTHMQITMGLHNQSTRGQKPLCSGCMLCDDMKLKYCTFEQVLNSTTALQCMSKLVMVSTRNPVKIVIFILWPGKSFLKSDK